MVFLDFVDPIARVVLEALLNGLWQGIALTAFAFCLLCVFRRINATTRYLIWWVILIAVISLPLLKCLSIPGGSFAGSPAISHVDQRSARNASQRHSASGTGIPAGDMSNTIAARRALGSFREERSINFRQSSTIHRSEESDAVPNESIDGTILSEVESPRR